jgi:hypothetical protein
MDRFDPILLMGAGFDLRSICGGEDYWHSGCAEDGFPVKRRRTKQPAPTGYLNGYYIDC